MIRLSSPRDIDALARAGEALARVLDAVAFAAAPGVSPSVLDELAREWIAREGAEPLLSSERTDAGGLFPGVLSVSVNDEAANAPPGDRTLAGGDVLTLDSALRLDGFCVDAARSMTVGDPRPRRGLLQAADAVTRLLIDRIAPGVRWASLIHLVEAEAARFDCRVAPTAAGHGTGRSLHEPPRLMIPAREDVTFRPGMVLAVEPIVLEGRRGEGVQTAPDGVTIKSRDGSRAAFEERTIVVTRDACRVLTPLSPPRLAGGGA